MRLLPVVFPLMGYHFVCQIGFGGPCDCFLLNWFGDDVFIHSSHDNGMRLDGVIFRLMG